MTQKPYTKPLTSRFAKLSKTTSPKGWKHIAMSPFGTLLGLIL